MMVLVSSPKDLNLIALNGDISTLDLLHLRGHFGIPRFSGDGFVPGPHRGRAVPTWRLRLIPPCRTRLQTQLPGNTPAALASASADQQ